MVARSSAGARWSWPATRSPPPPSVKDIARAGRDGVLRVRDRVGQPGRRDGLHRDLDQHRAGETHEARRRVRAQGHPRSVSDRPLRGRLRGLQPDPHRRGVRAPGRPARAHPPRPVDDGPGRSRPHRGARRPCTSSSGSASSSAAWACSSRRSPSTARSAPSRATARQCNSAAQQGGKKIIKNGEAELRLD